MKHVQEAQVAPALKRHAAGLLIALCTGATPAVAFEGDKNPVLSWPGITGTWDGQRQAMEDNGLKVEAVYTGEFARNFTANPVTANGQIKTVYQTNMDLVVELDTEKAGLWPGGTFHLYGLGNTGGNPTTYTGDLQGYSNIEAPNQYILYEAWYQQEFADGMVSILAGLHDLNSEFYVSEYGGLFLNSSFGIGPEMTGNVAASIFPKAGLGARLRVKPVDNFYVQAAVYDGDPATRGFRAGEGKMMIAEAGITSGDSNAYKLGYWQHTASFTFGAQTFSKNYGMYAVVDQQLAQFDSGGAIGAFVQYGYSPKGRNAIYTYIGAGLHLHGLIPGRSEDDLGLGMARADYHASPTSPKASETALELTYRIVAAAWLAVQPSFQWISNPGGDPAAPTVKAGLLRFEVAL